MSRRIRTACALAAVSSAVLALAGPALPAAAVPAPATALAPAAAPGTGTIASGQLSVAVATDFPRVISYTDTASGAVLGASSAPVTAVTLNGTAYPVALKQPAVLDAASARYTLVFPALSGVELDASLSVSGRVTTFRVDAVRDTTAFRVGTIDIPGHDLVAVASTDTGAATAFTTLDPDSTRTADVFGTVTSGTAAQSSPVGATYAIVNTGRLAAAVESDSSYDKPSGATDGDDARFWHQAVKGSDGTVRVGVRSGQWTYRGAGSDRPATGDGLPWAKVVVTPDANGDGLVDWQDGAVAFRSIAVQPQGGDQTPNRVITHIPFNFASQATHPFLRTLDDVKRLSLSTDGLGQLALLKGYQSEGHDSAHPDYGGNYNKRAGGLTDLNALLKDGRKWGATFGVHVNATEAYPVANHFSDGLVDTGAKGWNWLDQSYYIDQRKDINSGSLAQRFQQLRDETDANLSLLYLDVYYTHGWIADSTLNALRAQGWNVGTEWADKFERGSLWSHWANDLDYGGPTNKGLNSKIIRFIRNGQKDVWNSDPILGQTSLVGFEGWTGENDWNATVANVWQKNLPAKFLQHYDITKWSADRIDFTGNVHGATESGRRALYAGTAKVLDGDTYLLPWMSGWGEAEQQDKLYHYNKAGGTTTWTLPAAFASASSFTLYKLTDNGRVAAGTVTPSGGKVTLTAAANQAYALYPNAAPAQQGPQWGEGTLLKDPGFNANGLGDWTKAGTVANDTDGLGRRSAALTGTAAASLSQQITGLTPGAVYSASAWIEVAPGATRHTVLSAGGVSVAVDSSALQNAVAASDWHDTAMQRAKVNFTAPASGTVTFQVAAAAGSAAKVRVDDVRVVANAPATKAGTVAYEDFEAVDQGWGPFLKGNAGGVTDPRTHIAQKHAPYTQAGWNGKLTDDVIGGAESLKSHDENSGIVYRTAPWTVPMTAGHTYKVEFDYQSSHAGAYTWDTGTGTTASRRTALPQARTTTHFSEQVLAGAGSWVGLEKLGGAPADADLTLDGFTVTDLGGTPPPSGTWASDLTWVSATNGWGPAERDRSNGEQAAGDGGALTVGGTVYAKGLGTHAASTIRYDLAGKGCASFTAQVGVDDEQASRGSVTFTVLADGTRKAASPVLRFSDTAYTLTADVTGARYVDLVVGDGGDDNGNDHADWGNALFQCTA
ncbi:endo-alpha-N-acetylgalactosaminidase family protein [Streptomyces sp. NPDC006733]|uniref:endo-alpha-N-acetylgalactosaminidase family protein n=1 Tax=Streptomyces sp. NPDC006733 TaxID=3155460 RepID=UPI0033CC2D3E